MISMSKAYSIRQLRMEGDSIAEISRKLEVSRDTVYKYLAMEDLSQRPPAPRAKASVLDRYRPLIESWLDEDERNWRKQRHTARRIWARLRDEAGADVAESTVRNYVRRIKLERGASREQYLDLDWEPGDAQADFGEADFYVAGVRTRMSFFVMTFPYSNVGIAQVFPGDVERGPVPHWVEESDAHKERLSSERAKKYPYLLVSNHPHWRIHANLDDNPWTREFATCKIEGPDGYKYEPVWIHPSDATKMGVRTGDVVKLFNERGGVLGGVYVTERIMPGVVYQDHGARTDTIVGGEGGLDRGGANNLICPTATSSTHAYGEVTSGYLVGVEKVDVFELARQYPEAFNRPYDAEQGLIIESRLA